MQEHLKQEPKSLQKALEQKEQLEARIANERSKYAADLRIPYRLRRAWQKNREPDRALIKSVTEVTIMANPKDSTGRKFFRFSYCNYFTRKNYKPKPVCIYFFKSVTIDSISLTGM